MLKKMVNVALVITLLGSITIGSMICEVKHDEITNLDIAEFAVRYEYGDYNDVEIIEVRENENLYGGSTITCRIQTDDGRYCTTFNKKYYQSKLERELGDS